MTKLYLLAGRLDNDTRHALLAAADASPEPGWEPVRTGSRDSVLAGPGHFIKLLAPTPLSRASAFAPARLLIGRVGRAARLARREQGMNTRGIATAPIQARGLAGSREFLLTSRAHGQTLHALLPSLAAADKKALIHSLALAVAALHESGVYHGDLNCYNLIVAPDHDVERSRFTFLDNDSTRLYGRPISRTLALKNLSQLNFWVLPGTLHRSDRLRFLDAYLQARTLQHERMDWWKELAGRFIARQQRKQALS